MSKYKAGDVIGVDVNKQYASCLSKIVETRGFPIIHPFEKFYTYDGMPINKDYLYIVAMLEKHPIYNHNKMLLFGYELARFKLKHEILSYIPVS